jgi:heterodisulfide reductase subunit C/nitrate reductase gamma subunit
MVAVQRETFWMISFEYKVVLYVLAAVAMGVFAFGFYRRYRLWECGRREKVSWRDVKANFAYLWDMALKQKKLQHDKLYGFIHRFISYGFVILFIGTCLVFVDYDLGISILQGNVYRIYEVVLDVFGLLFIIGLLVAMMTRAGRKRERLKHGWMDQVFLMLFFLIGVGGYIVEAIRIGETQISHGSWSPVGYALSFLIKGVPVFALETYPIWWMSHAIFAFILIGMIPYTKLFHFFTAPINILFQPVKRTGMLSPTVMKSEGVHVVHVISDFTNWQLLSTDACTECGRCESQCPAHQSGKPLSPRSLVMSIRDHMEPNREIASFIEPEVLQSCTTCGACVEACPVSINHVDLILSMRRGLIQRMEMEPEAEQTLLKLEEQHNIWGKPWSERADWSKGLSIPVLDNHSTSKREGA